MKRTGMTAVIFLLFCHSNVYGLVSVSLEGAGGIFSCQSQEHVLENGSGLSRLEWQDPVIPIFTLRGKLESWGFFLGGGYFPTCRFKAAL
jgi:hypothetical protein